MKWSLVQLGPTPGLAGNRHQLVKIVLAEDQFSPAPGDVRQAPVVLVMGDIFSQPGVTIRVR